MSAPGEAAAAMKEAIARAVAGNELDAALMSRAMQALFSGETTPAQSAAFLVAVRMKGETPGELAEAARVMREHCVKVPLSARITAGALVDTCGTGGDGLHTFNISTAAAVVVASCGVPVAKHGNRAASSQTGSADVLEALGVSIELSPAQIARCIEEAGIGFMFARAHHPAMRHVGPVRAEIGVRTLFNFLGPLANPAGATHQVVGVSDPRMQTTMARALMQLGSRHGLVVHGHGGLDEIAVSGPTRACRVHGGSLSTIELTPEDFGVATQPEADLGGGDATHNAALIRALFGGERGARRDAVVINAGAALHIAGAADSWRTGAEKAQAAIDSGAASKTLSAWATLSKSSPP